MSQQYVPPPKPSDKLFSKPLRFIKCKHCKKPVYKWTDNGGEYSGWSHSDTRNPMCEIVVTYAEPDK